jgi:hypothetical protein
VAINLFDFNSRIGIAYIIPTLTVVEPGKKIIKPTTTKRLIKIIIQT